MFRAPNTCYTCGQADHFDKECPHNNFYGQDSNNLIVLKNDNELNPNAAVFQPPSIPQGDNSLLPPPVSTMYRQSVGRGRRDFVNIFFGLTISFIFSFTAKFK